MVRPAEICSRKMSETEKLQNMKPQGPEMEPQRLTIL